MRNDQSLFTVFVGVDVSKGKLDFAFADGQETWSIDNAQQPLVTQLIGRIKNRCSTIVVREATGGDEQALVTLLHQHHIAAAVRRVLDMATLVATRFNSRIKTFYQRLLE